MGYEVGGGRYVTFDDEEMKAVRPKSNRVIEVADFVALDEIDPIYFENTYWLVPDGDGAPRRATSYWSPRWTTSSESESARWCCGTGSTSRPSVRSTARWRCRRCGSPTRSCRARDIEGLPRRAKPDPKALNMAKQLIDGMTSEWDPEAVPRHVHR